MGATKPFVEVACICENVIIDKDGVATLIRLVDKFSAEVPDPLPLGAIPAFPLTVFIRLRPDSDYKPGVSTIKIKQPDGSYAPGKGEAKVEFAGPHQGVQFKADLMIVKPVTGLYWLEVSWNDEPLTRIAADVTVKTVPGPMPRSTGSASPLPSKP